MFWKKVSSMTQVRCDRSMNILFNHSVILNIHALSRLYNAKLSHSLAIYIYLSSSVHGMKRLGLHVLYITGLLK